MTIELIIVGLLVVVCGGCIFMFTRKSSADSLQSARKAIQQEKEERKQRILDLFDDQERIQNNDVENMLGVSDATATNYLDELEKEGRITQHGETGRGVFYTLKMNG